MAKYTVKAESESFNIYGERMFFRETEFENIEADSEKEAIEKAKKNAPSRLNKRKWSAVESFLKH